MSRITLQKLSVQGIAYRRTIEFNEDLTIISGEKTSGKSLILSLIDYCLGKLSKIDLKVQPELDSKCDQVFLEMRIDEEVLTLNRMLKEKQSKIIILDEYTPKTFDIQEAMKILMHKLNINELIRTKNIVTKKKLRWFHLKIFFGMYISTNMS